ncbi:MAG: T9SS type A sorting domain-containing protein [Bacteroidetes bacterium]|nr:T9SS type A sorting domain-containing protein [Bacteroidota bacterium]
MRLTLRFYPLLLVLCLSGVFVQARTAPAHVTASPVIGTTTFSGLFSGTTSLGSGGVNTLTALNVGGSGWDYTVTGTSTSLAILVPNGGGADDGSTSDFCIRTGINAAVPDGQTFIKTNDGAPVSLKSIFFRANIMGSGSADITLTGFRLGVAVPGATLTMTLAGTPTTAWTKFDVSSILAFSSVDQISFKQASSTNLNITFMVTDNIAIAATNLPLTLINFSGRLADDNVQLQWTTAQESNTSHFEVQRANNGTDFSTIGSVQAAGNSSQTLHYNYTDALPPVGSPSYLYRLKMADLDGRYTYSSVLRIGTASQGASVAAFPNPFQQQVVLTVNAPEAEQTQLTVTDMNGKIVQRQKLFLQKGVNSFTLSSLSSLGKGSYLLSVAISRRQQTLKVVKVE